MKHISPLFILLMIGVCTVSCKGNPAEKQKELKPCLQSFKGDDHVISRGYIQKGELYSLEYDDQGRLLGHKADTLHYTFDYTDAPRHIAIVCTSQKDGSVVSSSVVTTHADGTFARKEKHYKQHGRVTGVDTVIICTYTHDEQGRLLHFRREGAIPFIDNHPNTLELALNWEDGDNVKEVRMTTVYPEETRTLTCTMEYIDEEMPWQFYPEVYTVLGIDIESGLTGINGYSHKNLLKRIAVKVDEAETPYVVFDFAYQHDADGKLTEFLMKIVDMDIANDSVVSTDGYSRYYDFVY